MEHLKEKICWRCGESLNDFKRYGQGCKVWDKSYKTHLWKIDGEHRYDELLKENN